MCCVYVPLVICEHKRICMCICTVSLHAELDRSVCKFACVCLAARKRTFVFGDDHCVCSKSLLFFVTIMIIISVVGVVVAYNTYVIVSPTWVACALKMSQTHTHTHRNALFNPSQIHKCTFGLVKWCWYSFGAKFSNSQTCLLGPPRMANEKE